MSKCNTCKKMSQYGYCDNMSDMEIGDRNPCRDGSMYEPREISHADRIRSMSDEKLAVERVEKMKQISPYNDCYPIMYFCSDGYGTDNYNEAILHELNWLRSPVEE